MTDASDYAVEGTVKITIKAKPAVVSTTNDSGGGGSLSYILLFLMLVLLGRHSCNADLFKR